MPAKRCTYSARCHRHSYSGQVGCPPPPPARHGLPPNWQENTSSGSTQKSISPVLSFLCIAQSIASCSRKWRFMTPAAAWDRCLNILHMHRQRPPKKARWKSWLVGYLASCNVSRHFAWFSVSYSRVLEPAGMHRKRKSSKKPRSRQCG